MSGELSAGDQLPGERELAAQMRVSRAAVREAVKTLRERGLVEIKVGRGTFVADIEESSVESLHNTLSLLTHDSDSQDDLLQIRAIFEPAIAALAAPHLSDADIAELEIVVHEMDLAMDDPERFVSADLEFHNIIARATGNRLIPILLSSFMTLLRDQRKRTFNTSNGPQNGQIHHKKILAALRGRDSAAARDAMAAHIQQVRRDSIPKQNND